MVVIYEGKKDQILADGKTFKEPVVVKNCQNCQLVNCKFDGTASRAGVNMLEAVDIQNCKFVKPEFFGKKNKGLCFNLTGPKSDGNEVIDGYWHDIGEKDEVKRKLLPTNGMEPMRIGNSDLSHCWLNTKVENPRFENIYVLEPEIISIKSCGNWIVNPQVKNCPNMAITIRHGHTTTIQGGTIEGNSGIRVYGKSNKIDGIHFKNNSSSKGCIRVMNGDTINDPNETAGIPLGQKHPDHGHATYTQVRGGTLLNCVFEECKYPVNWGYDNLKYKPSGVKFVSNHYIANKVECSVINFSNIDIDKEVVGIIVFEDNTYEGGVKVNPKIASGFKKGADNVPEPKPDPDPDPGPEPRPDPDPTPKPDPSEETTEYSHVCQVDGVEEARTHLGIWVCAKDVDKLRPSMIQWFAEAKKSLPKDSAVDEQPTTT